MKVVTEKISLEVELPTRILEAMADWGNPYLLCEIALLKSLKAGLDYYWPIGDPFREVAEKELDELLARKRLS
jgi:hypothetical protein